MNVEIMPSCVKGTFILPRDKSETHRALIVASLSCGEVRTGQRCDDVQATLAGLLALGAQADVKEQVVRFLKPPHPDSLPATVDCGESASTFRFLLPLAIGLRRTVRFFGSTVLLSRVKGDAIALCDTLGFSYQMTNDSFFVCGECPLPPRMCLPALSSGQLISGLLMILPLLPGKWFLSVKDPVSTGYVTMTVNLLRECGAVIEELADGYAFSGGQCYRPKQFVLHGDASAACYAHLLRCFGGDVTFDELFRPDHPDARFCKLLALLSEGKTVDLSGCPDSAPALLAAAALTGGRLTGLHRLIAKESDRRTGMIRMLTAFGVTLRDEGDSLVILPSLPARPLEPITTANDHRLVMTAACLASMTGGIVTDVEAVSKSFPDFWNVMERVGVRYRMIE